MAFQQFQLTRSFNQSRGIFDKYIYKPNDNDLIADILTTGYFDESRYIDDPKWIGSIIEISASDGFAIGRIVSGGVITLYDSTGAGSINVEWGAITGNILSQVDLQAQFEDITPDNQIVINSEGDFPTQDATTITLSSNTKFIIGAPISSTKRFICEDGFVLTSENQLGLTYTYTGTGDMFTGSLVGGIVENIALDAPNASQGFNMSDTGLTKIFICRNVRFSNVPKWGTYTGFVTTLTKTSSSGNSDNGLTIAGTGQLIVQADSFAILSSNAACVQIDFGAAVISNIELNNLILVAPLGGIQISGSANSANVPVGALAMVTNSSVLGGATQQLSGVSVDDTRWDFKGNTPTSDSISDALIHTSSNALVTTISTQDAAVKINAIFVVDDISRFTSDGTGRLDYIGDRDERLPIDIVATLLAEAGGDQQLNLCIAINGTEVNATCVQGTASATKSTALMSIWQHNFQQGDYIEAFISNSTSTTNVVAPQVVIRVN